MRPTSDDADVFRAIRELLVRHGPDLDWTRVTGATGLTEGELRTRYASLEALLVLAFEPSTSPESAAAPPTGAPTEQRIDARSLPQLAQLFRRLGPATTPAPAAMPEIKRLESLPPPDATAR